MISPEKEAEILRLFYAEKWLAGTVAAQLHVHHSTVRRVLTRAGIPAAMQSSRPSMADPYLPLVVEQLGKYPRLTASRLFQMVKQRGYAGGPDHFRSIVARHRPRAPAEAFLRLSTLPAEQGQVDWAHFGKVKVGKAQRALMAFVMVLSYSRHIFLRFYYGAAMANFLRGHVDAFEFFGGVPRTLLYDNLKSAVLERVGDAIRLHPTMLELAGHYRFAAKPVAVRKGNQKGRVERAIGYARTSFFGARQWTDLNDLNAQAQAWVNDVTAERKWPQDESRLVKDAYVEEKEKLLPLPDNPFPSDEKVTVSISKTPYARFDLNDYSVPHTHVRRELLVVANMTTVRILDGTDLIATHQRSWDRDQLVEQEAHVQALVDYKRKARTHHGLDLVQRAAPNTATLLQTIAERGGNVGAATWGLQHLLSSYGGTELDAAVAEALRRQTPHLSAVRMLLEQTRRARDAPPPIPVELPDDPRVRNLVVRPHSLHTYDQLQDPPDENPDPTKPPKKH